MKTAPCDGWKRLRPAALPAGMPDADGLGGAPELAGDLGLAHPGGEQLPSVEPAGLEPVAFSLCRRAARNGWHGINPHPPSPPLTSPCSSNPTPKALLSIVNRPGIPGGSDS
jgi:hypothetical protein